MSEENNENKEYKEENLSGLKKLDEVKYNNGLISPDQAKENPRNKSKRKITSVKRNDLVERKEKDVFTDDGRKLLNS